MKVVIDTNVIISGLYSKRGASFKIIEAAISKKLYYSITPLVILEYIGKIDEKNQEGLLDLPISAYLKIVEVLIENGQQILEPILNRPILPDNGDDKILECAIAGQCNFILTFNIKDFPADILRLFNIQALTPGEFIKKGEIY